MRFFQIVASSAAFIAAALALEINQFPAGGVKAGQSYTITYSPASDIPTTFVLRKGLSTDLDTVGTLTTSATGGSFTWTVSDDLTNGADYALEIRQEGQKPNYSAQFGLTGGETASASVSSAISSIISSARSSASASASASLSSLITSVASSAAASATVSSSAGLNSTVSSATLSHSSGSAKPTGSATKTSSITPPESTGAASMLGSSPLALLFGAVGAFAFLN